MRSTIRPPVDPNTAGSAVENLDPATTTTAPTGAGKNTEATGAEEKEPFLGLKPTQLIGGALASCTAAVLGGQLGVAGTVAGAALTSLTIAVGGAVYTRTFDKTKDGIDTAVSKFRLAGTPPVTDPAAAVSPDDDPTRVHAIQAYAAPDDPTRIVAAQAVAKTEADQATPWFRRFSLVKVLAAAAALFIIAAVAVTGLEALRGSSVSGGEGTTISQIQRGDVTTSHSRTTPTEPAAEPSQDPAAGEPTPAPTGEATPQA
ncbi:MAG: hypothetical protein Q4G46_01625, partial [Propionibacteriaceae bacterium]|nr:hypothetical protein [Propionibacteriaceae bacterium]